MVYLETEKQKNSLVGVVKSSVDGTPARPKP